MDVLDAPLALMAFLGFVAVAPAWFWMVTQHPSLGGLDPSSQFLLSMLFPATVLLYLTSWLQGGASV